MSYPPRMGDLPRKELMKAADEAKLRYAESDPEIHFKFTCQHCGERCTLSKANTLHENGECYKCGKETKIERGGFMMQLRL